MINREWQSVSVITFTTGTDAYGQKRKQGSTSRSVEMVVKTYNQSNTNDVRYVDVELLGITKDSTITTANQISINNVSYQILYTIPSGKYLLVLMKKA